MIKVLVPMNRPKRTEAVADYLKRMSRHAGELEVTLLHVAPRLTRHASRWIRGADRTAAAHEAARTALTPFAADLRAAGIRCEMLSARGELSQAVAATAKARGCTEIVMASRRRSNLLRFLDNSAANRVMARTAVPVAVIPEGTSSLVERFVVPSGIGAALVLLALD